MNNNETLASRFETERPRLHAVAFRMLGTASEAEDAVQETWLRLAKTDASDIRNLSGWLTTVTSRVCLTMLGTRQARGEEPLDTAGPEDMDHTADADPVEQAVMAESVGRALLVVLDSLTPAERIAFVLHDLFTVPFEGIAAILERSPTATRQLASRARRRITGTTTATTTQPATTTRAGLERQRQLANAFLTATRRGDLTALMAVLHPEVEYRADATVGPTRAPAVLRGIQQVTRGTLAGAQRAQHAALLRDAEPALVNGRPGIVWAPLGRLRLAMAFTVTDDRISRIEAIADPDRLRHVELALPDMAVNHDTTP
ncbi:sigma-70 family RNA polymerase sigma factor [Streptomyces sp. SBT349]|uniref:sigma-70 family RNA polymerase sigma factor n=1 Tax=Streptomyces sp. SBT349 TaxID=1580539 RepID=UPI00066E7574|nr:sigma-70 family RNA polymerase sigma factor [Streptomyces sp. SBT349]